MTSGHRPATRLQVGLEAEEAAASFFEASGFAILGRNVRVGRLEIDILLRDGPVIVVVEVRTRGPGAWVGALASVDQEKQKRVRRAGERLWQRVYKKDRSLDRMRFDIASVTFDEDGRASIEHVRAAF